MILKTALKSRKRLTAALFSILVFPKCILVRHMLAFLSSWQYSSKCIFMMVKIIIGIILLIKRIYFLHIPILNWEAFNFQKLERQLSINQTGSEMKRDAENDQQREAVSGTLDYPLFWTQGCFGLPR
jgi:hypothetical protein